MSTITFLLTKTKSGFSSTPESASVTEANTTLLFQLDAGSAAEWELSGYTSSDRMSQLGPAVIASDGASMTINDVNTEAESFNITVTAKHRQTGEQHYIDPQIFNQPPQ